jgi:P4 family phage/plasmid primase-like protien
MIPPDELTWDGLDVASTFAGLKAEAHEAAETDPIARHELAYLTPDLIEAAAVTRANLAAQEAEASRPLTNHEQADYLAIVEAERVRLGLPTLAATLEVIDPIPPRRTNGAAHDTVPQRVTEPPAHLVRQSRAAWYFAAMAGDRVRFDHGRGRWLIWAGHRWRPDEDGSVQRLWLTTLATRFRQALKADDHERARLTADVQTAGATNAAITAGLEIASSMEPIATTSGAWDPDPWQLGCENGVVELRTGRLRPGRPEDMISRSTGVLYDPGAPCPRWSRFLAEVFAGDAELVDWYGLLIGTSLVGVVVEILALHHGLGNNGKSVAVRALRRAIGDYAAVIPVETLVNAKRAAGEATPDLMALRGARLAFTSEPDQTAKLRGGVLKRLASIDRMTGRSLYGMTQTWEPTHTVHLATNHLPAVDDATDGFWRRVALVPWTVRFRKPGEDGDAPPEDPNLAAALALEAPGILAWAVRGAVAFAAGRMLHPFPASVRARTAAYRADEDKLGAFVAERVVYERDASVAVGALFAAYRDWCEASGIPTHERMSQKALAPGFEERGHGIRRGRDAANRVIFTGTRLALSTNPEHPEHSTPVAGTFHTTRGSEKVRQPPLNAPDAPETGAPENAEPLPVAPADLAPESPAAARPPCAMDPDTFRAHASSRRLVNEREVCDACQAGAVP